MTANPVELLEVPVGSVGAICLNCGVPLTNPWADICTPCGERVTEHGVR